MVQLLKWAFLFLLCIASAIGISYLIAVPQPPEETAETVAVEDSLDDKAIAEMVKQTLPPQPSITLPTRAMPANKDQLRAEAEFVANRLRQNYPDRAEALHVAAMMSAQFSQSAEAEELWKQCIALDPLDPRYYINFAAVAMDRGDSELAAETLRKAYKAGVTSPDLMHHLGVALNKTGKADEAEKVIKQAIEKTPNLAALWMVLGQAQLRQRKLPEAEASLKKSLEMGHESAAAYTSLANALAQQGKEEDAQKYRALVSDKNGGDDIDARQRFQTLSLAEAHQAALNTLIEAASVQIRMGNSLAAEQLLLRALALDPANFVGCQVLAELYHDAGLAAEERVVRQRIVDLAPFDLANHLKLAAAAQSCGDRPSAEAALKFTVSISPNTPEPYLALAQFHLEGSDLNRARWYTQEALLRQPTASGFRLLATICQQMGDESNAIAALEEAQKIERQQVSSESPQ
ncbi:hypothetical protein DTL42_02570 [Bremerella cremea]|uniref:Tetratricopeptide repeat protein n=1 Tax=Bremerella cremea TaxID=1031537 RepID=A0A368KWX8_9BACT|nr:tetratricopeptide repeat protein [Bremerella cremea]RCS54910.1 hypothetical protein DTL42_02570 [Bremerella cremea]